MGTQLKSPPFLEVLCEFRFDPGSSWDWTIPGRLYDGIRDEFSERVGGVTLDASVKAQESKSDATPSSQPQKVQLRRPDGTAMVQLGPHFLAVNHFRPYRGWERFRPLVLDVFEKHARITGNQAIVRVSLRYINSIAMPEGNFRLGRFITVEPPLRGSLERPLSKFYQRYDLLHEDLKGVLIHQTGIAGVDGKPALMLDLDFVGTGLSNAKSTSDIGSYLDACHDRVEEAFIASLNPEFLERLK